MASRHEFTRIPVEGTPHTNGARLVSLAGWSVACILVVSFAAAILSAILSPDMAFDNDDVPPAPPLERGSATARPTALAASASIDDLKRYYGGSDLARAFSVHEGVPGVYGDNAAALVSSFASVKPGEPIVVGIVGNAAVGGHGNCHVDAYPVLLQRQLGSRFKVRSVAVGPWCGASPSATLACATELLGPVDVAQVSFSFQSGGDKARFVRGLKLLLEQLNGRVHVVDVGYECDADVQAVVAPYAGKGSNVFCLSRLVASDPGVWGAEGDWLGHMRTRANASGVVWRNWRLGPMGHQIVADAFTLLYAKLASAASSSSSTREQRRSVAPACRTGALVAIPPNVDEVPAVDRNRAECALDSDVCGFVPIATGASQQYVFGATANEGAEVHVCCCCNDELCIKEQLQDGMAAFHVDASGGSVTAARAESAVGRECLMVAKLTGLAKSVTVKVSNVGQPATVDHVIKIGKVLVM